MPPKEDRSDPDEVYIQIRQKYIGPQIRKYGNFLRVNDCPASGLTNRIGTIDLRLLSGDTATHSDMLMWHKDEKPEDAALQIISSIFSTVQISLQLETVKDEMREMLTYWMTFMKKYVKLLQCTQIRPLEPENLYPEVSVEDTHTCIQVNYSKGRVVNITDKKDTFIYIHGTKEDQMVFKMDGKKKYEYTVFDCKGKEIKADSFENEKWGEIIVPTAGMVIFK